MRKPLPWFWVAFLLILLLPTTAGRLILDITGGLLIFLLILPFLIGGAGWIGWKIIQSKMKTCNSCGASFMNNLSQCPICGSNMYTEESQNKNINIPASSATIDITPSNTNQNEG